MHLAFYTVWAVEEQDVYEVAKSTVGPVTSWILFSALMIAALTSIKQSYLEHYRLLMFAFRAFMGFCRNERSFRRRKTNKKSAIRARSHRQIDKFIFPADDCWNL